MTYYEDRTFCEFEECLLFKSCKVALTNDIKEEARLWRSPLKKEQLPICVFATKPTCFKEKFMKKEKIQQKIEETKAKLKELEKELEKETMPPIVGCWEGGTYWSPYHDGDIERFNDYASEAELESGRIFETKEQAELSAMIGAAKTKLKQAIAKVNWENDKWEPDWLAQKDKNTIEYAWTFKSFKTCSCHYYQHKPNDYYFENPEDFKTIKEKLGENWKEILWLAILEQAKPE